MDDITICSYAVAFLKRPPVDGAMEGAYLLMKRADSRAVAPSVWSGVGGKLERHEIHDPRAACLREIEEETGIRPEEVRGLTLRYLLLRRAGTVLRHSYVYFGETDTDFRKETAEGSLHWVPRASLTDRPFSMTYGSMLRHYLSSADTGMIYAGVADGRGRSVEIIWTPLADWE